MGTSKEADQLITLACPVNHNGEHYSRELANEQTLENLAVFSEKLDRAHDVLVKNGHCTCSDRASLAKKAK